MGSEKFCLRWNDFESNISVAFRELRDDKDFFDVTLACDDEQIQAHKVILSACSPFFRNVLRRNPHQHPLLYLKGVKFTDLQSVLNFMYHGEVNVAQEELNSFLVVAEELRVKGLTQNGPKPGGGAGVLGKTIPEPQLSTRPPRPKSPHSTATPPPPKRIRPAPRVEDDEIQEVVDVEMPVKREMPEPQVGAQQPEKYYGGAHPGVQEATVGGQLEAYQGGEFGVEEGYEDYGDQFGGEGAFNGHGGQVDASGKGLVLPGMERSYLLDQGGDEVTCSICLARFSRKDNARRHVMLRHGQQQEEGSKDWGCSICFKGFKNELALDNHRRNIHKVYKTPQQV